MSETVEDFQVKTKQETDRKCPSCGGVLSYSPTTKNLVCVHCDYQEEIINTHGVVEEVDIFSATAFENVDWGTKTKRVICESCGAESIYDALEVASVCPYCDSNQVMEAYDEESLAPHGVCPFEINQDQGVMHFKSWLNGKWFCPSVAKKQANPEKLHGVYLPYWTFDTMTYSSYKGQYGITKTRTDNDGKVQTYTDWYWTSGNYKQFIDDYLVVGTNRISEKDIRNLGSFDTNNSLGYLPEYLAGFSAERYSIGVKESWEDAKNGIYNALRYEIKEHIRQSNFADDAQVNSLSVDFKNIGFKYLMLPVWISSYRYKDVIYHFYVNGQTGQVCGKSPISPIRVTIAVVLILMVVIFIFMAFQQK